MSNQNNEQPQIDLISYEVYYQEEFKKIIESNEKYRGKWNWFSFLFSWIWLFGKGAWGMGLIILGITLLTFGSKIFPIFFIIWSIQSGRRGTWIYYNAKIKNNQFPNSLL